MGSVESGAGSKWSRHDIGLRQTLKTREEISINDSFGLRCSINEWPTGLDRKLSYMRSRSLAPGCN
jgi:hypothetical protein